jgi:hypothetical protein
MAKCLQAYPKYPPETYDKKLKASENTPMLGVTDNKNKHLQKTGGHYTTSAM